MTLDEQTRQAHALMPYAKAIGLEVLHLEKEGGQYRLPFREDNIGNTFLPALHGGLMGGFMESAAGLFLYATGQLSALPRVVDFSVDYLRSGQPQDLYARCVITRQGSRIAHVGVSAWQHHPDKPVALARAHFQLPLGA